MIRIGITSMRAAVLAAVVILSPPRELTAQTPPATSAGTEVADTVLQRAAELAWLQFEALWVAETGLAHATPDYDKLTSWDIGSVIAALYSARILQLLPEDAYLARMQRTLQTVNELPLDRGVAYHKLYSAPRARLVNRSGAVSNRGYGWSTTDLGRLLNWLAIVARNEPAMQDLAESAARRVAFDSIVSAGYLYGEERIGQRTRRFQEGRIGYEQYAAAGFAAWGARVESALDVNLNAQPVTVAGVTLAADRRQLDRIVSEPFILLGLERGWTAEMRPLALAVLAAQEAASEDAGAIRMMSEDAVGVPPFYFYYYCIYCSGRAFVVEAVQPGEALADAPRWLSTKSAFAWYALAPGDFTRAAVAAVQPAADARRGWSSGLFETSGKPTHTYDINTAAVILEAAAFARIGRPLDAWRPR